MSDDESSQSETEQSEAEKVMKKRQATKRQESKGLEDNANELLEANRQDRERMEEEIQELRERNLKRKKQREVEEKRQAAERLAEEERRKTLEEEKRKKKEEEDMNKHSERIKKQAEFDKWKNTTGPNFVISKKSESEDPDVDEKVAPKKSREQLDAEKKTILKQRLVPLEISGFDASKLNDKAKELYKTIVRLEGEKYDLEQRFKLQQVDMMELAEKARQANKVGKGGLKRTQAGEEVDIIQARYAGAPAKIEMYSKYERQKDKRHYNERKDFYSGPRYAPPPDRIKPSKAVKLNEEGMPQYVEANGVVEEGVKEE